MTKTQTHSHRELELLEALRQLGGSARSAELARVLDVSEETVRRTIKALAKADALERVHGGAYLPDTQAGLSFFSRMTQYPDEKRAIARCAARHIDDGMTLFLDVGSTTAFVSEELRARHNLTVVTNSIGVAQTLVNHNNNRVHFLGGEMQGNERGTFGFVTENQIRRFVFDMAVLSADALSPKQGVLFTNAIEANLAIVASESADQVAFAIDHHKFDGTAPHCGPDMRQVDMVFTDAAPNKRLRAAFKEWGVAVHVAGQTEDTNDDE
ncbi:DeoR/GlpR family DNA-binding transcription regulator [Falsiruegeria mediterranea]|uniref:Glycerol-3-phosphate regulon repressor n=1 Tax=Falsiruegeria mediterranea M17 TaxID=1200281 RepID=A0A2R8CDQ8_9RHOB|nr:DeoR/GlpR family DNA-binding transcription regulator [Falsiruegeria mediterranea]SPJ30532.1 Glycerol-3-phosphate regulon repressor [Falsiruegeria mediterranea M17]